MAEEVKETPEQLKSKRDQLCFRLGQHSFTEAIIKAEMLQWQQEILRINNELAKLPAEPLKAVEPDAVLPADPETPKIV